MKYIKVFNNHSDYEAFTATTEFVKPNFTYCKDQPNVVHYNPYIEETRVVAKFNITSTSEPTLIGYNNYISGFSSIEIDGVEQPTVVSSYTFSTTGEHTVKYTLTVPTTINVCAFESCENITSIDIPSNVTSIGSNSFRVCNGLTTITIPDSVTNIGNYTFAFCSNIASVNIGSGISSIGYFAFAECNSLTSINISSGTIGESAFDTCTGLTSVIIGSGVTFIDSYVFYDCSSLESITVNSTTPPTLGNGVFASTNNCPIYVPSGSVEIYKSANGWSTYASRIQAISNE